MEERNGKGASFGRELMNHSSKRIWRSDDLGVLHSEIPHFYHTVFIKYNHYIPNDCGV